MYRAPRGTADTLPEEQRYWRYIEARAEALGRRFGYGAGGGGRPAASEGDVRLEDPRFRLQSDLFTRGVGQGTDDRREGDVHLPGPRRATPWPCVSEGTAPTSAERTLEHGMRNLPQPGAPLLLLPCIQRYERRRGLGARSWTPRSYNADAPAAARLGLNHQFGVEALGDGDPSVEAEIIEMAWQLTKDLG